MHLICDVLHQLITLNVLLEIKLAFITYTQTFFEVEQG